MTAMSAASFSEFFKKGQKLHVNFRRSRTLMRNFAHCMLVGLYIKLT